MKYKHLILSSIFCFAKGTKSELVTSKNFSNDECSLGQIQAIIKPEVLHDNFIVTLGIANSGNIFGGVGGTFDFEYSNYMIQSRAYVLLADSKNFEFSKKYLKKIPLIVTAATDIWGFNVGAGATINFNKEFSVFTFLNVNAADNFDVSICYNIYGNTAFLYADVVDHANLEQLIKEYKYIEKNFKSYYDARVEKNQETEFFKKAIIRDARNKREHLENLKLGNNVSLKSESFLVIGSAGTGKNYLTYDILMDYINGDAKDTGMTLCKLDSISMMKLNGTTLTPTGYVGNDFKNEVEKAMNESLKSGRSKLAVSLGYMQLDEIDAFVKKGMKTSSSGGGFEGSVQKEILEFVKGEMTFSTTSGNIFTAGIFRCCLGAFQDEQNSIKFTAYLSLYNNFDSLFKFGNRNISKIMKNRLFYVSDMDDLDHSLLIFSDRLKNNIGEDGFKSLKDEHYSLYGFKNMLENAYEQYSKDEKLKTVSFGIYAKIKKLENFRLFAELDNRNKYYIELLKNLYVIQIDPSLKTEEEKKKKFINVMIELIEFYVKFYLSAHTADLLEQSGLGKEVIRRADTCIFIHPLTQKEAIEYLENTLKEPFKTNGLIDDQLHDYCQSKMERSTECSVTKNEIIFDDLRGIIKFAKEDIEEAKLNRYQLSVINGNLGVERSLADAQNNVQDYEYLINCLKIFPNNQRHIEMVVGEVLRMIDTFDESKFTDVVIKLFDELSDESKKFITLSDDQKTKLNNGATDDQKEKVNEIINLMSSNRANN